MVINAYTKIYEGIMHPVTPIHTFLFFELPQVPVTPKKKPVFLQTPAGISLHLKGNVYFFLLCCFSSRFRIRFSTASIRFSIFRSRLLMILSIFPSRISAG